MYIHNYNIFKQRTTIIFTKNNVDCTVENYSLYIDKAYLLTLFIFVPYWSMLLNVWFHKLLSKMFIKIKIQTVQLLESQKR